MKFLGRVGGSRQRDGGERRPLRVPGWTAPPPLPYGRGSAARRGWEHCGRTAARPRARHVVVPRGAGRARRRIGQVSFWCFLLYLFLGGAILGVVRTILVSSVLDPLRALGMERTVVIYRVVTASSLSCSLNSFYLFLLHVCVSVRLGIGNLLCNLPLLWCSNYMHPTLDAPYLQVVELCFDYLCASAFSRFCPSSYRVCICSCYFMTLSFRRKLYFHKCVTVRSTNVC